MKRALLVAVALAVLGGCAVGPDYKRPGFAAPAVFDGGAAKEAAIDASWWASFHDPLLSRLVETAVASSARVREAEARVREARALRRAETARLFPKIDTTLGYSNSRISEHGFIESFSGGGGGGGGGAVFPGQEIDLFQSGFDAQWEIDIFGHVRRAMEASRDETEAREAALADVRLSIAAETAREVIEIRSLDERLRIAQRNIEAQAGTRDSIRDRHRAGIASGLEVERADAQLSATETALPTLRAQRAAALHRLEVLVGSDAATLSRDFEKEAPVPEPPATIDAGLPAQLLLRRPDIARAERDLAAATARSGVARAELFPRFSLTGSFGLQSQDISDLITVDSRFWYVGPGVRWPVFDAGRLMAAVNAADARTDAAAARYELTVRAALADVETALTSLAAERERTVTLARAAASEKNAADLAAQLYRNGMLAQLDVLEAQRSLFRVEDTLAASRAAVSADTVALFKALGGGWAPAGS